MSILPILGSRSIEIQYPLMIIDIIGWVLGMGLLFGTVYWLWHDANYQRGDK